MSTLVLPTKTRKENNTGKEDEDSPAGFIHVYSSGKGSKFFWCPIKIKNVIYYVNKRDGFGELKPLLRHAWIT